MSWPDGYGRRVLTTTDSTNAEAARRAGDLAGPEWICALQQTAARGRRGRVWHMPQGNFAATLVMRPVEPPAHVALRSFVMALALAEAVDDVTGRPDQVALKWPNDVLLNGGKLAGILLESLSSGSDIAHLAIGVGVNLASAPEAGQVEAGAMRPVSLLGETGVVITPPAFLDHLARAYARREAQFTTLGFAPIREAWLDRAAKLGEVITARTIRDETTGTFETVDAHGNLVLSTAQARIAIAAADVFF